MSFLVGGSDIEGLIFILPYYSECLLSLIVLFTVEILLFLSSFYIMIIYYIALCILLKYMIDVMNESLFFPLFSPCFLLSVVEWLIANDSWSLFAFWMLIELSSIRFVQLVTFRSAPLRSNQFVTASSKRSYQFVTISSIRLIQIHSNLKKSSLNSINLNKNINVVVNGSLKS